MKARSTKQKHGSPVKAIASVFPRLHTKLSALCICMVFLGSCKTTDSHADLKPNDENALMIKVMGW